ncbi:MAG: response regulator [Leptospiraceae bacterium]|nr:response regulator [Leptospiraceae bacterium]
MKEILLCDDAPMILKIMEMILKDEGYGVTKSSNAEEALARIAENPNFSLGIFDINMPKKNGLELSREVLAHPNGKNMKIMIVSTEASEHLKSEAKKIGVKAWLTKPYKDDDLLEVVKKLIGEP